MIRTLLPLLLVSVALLLDTAGAVAQATHVPGVDGKRLRLGIDSMAVYLVQGRDSVPTGMLWDELRVVDENGSAVLQRVYRSQDQVMGVRVDTLVDQYSSLLALRHRSRSSRSQEFLDFTSGRVRGWVRLANGDSSDVDVAIPPSVHNGNSFDLILRAAPLATGWSTEVPSFLASTRSIVPLRARVVGREVIDGESCWRVDADFGGTAVSFWIHEQSRDLWQQVMHLGPDLQVLFRRPGTTKRPATPRQAAG